ncbi:MAG: hypothetical protein ABH842_02495 [Candidatus Micrarchaeota archaeon]
MTKRGTGVPDKKEVRQPDLDVAKRNIRKVLGSETGSVGAALVEGLDAVKGNVDAQLDGLRADARGAKEAAEEAKGKLTQATTLVEEQGHMLEGFIGEQSEAAVEIRGNSEVAATSALEAADAAQKAQSDAADLKGMVDSITITVGEKELKGPEALEQISSVVAAIAEVSIAVGTEELKGPEAVAQLVRSIGSLEIMRGEHKVVGMEVLGEMVSGIESITINRPVQSKPADRTEVLVEGMGESVDHSVDFGTPEVKQLKGLEALAYLCAQVDNLQDPMVMKGVVSVSLDELFSATVQVPDNGSGELKTVRKKGVELLGYMFDALEKVKFELPEQTRKAVDDVFTCRVTIDGEERTLSGAELSAYLVAEVGTAKRSAGSAVREASEARKAADRAEGLVEQANGLLVQAQEAVAGVQEQLSGVEGAVKAAFEVVDQKLAALFDMLTAGRDLSETEMTQAELMLKPSYEGVAKTTEPVEDIKR